MDNKLFIQREDHKGPSGNRVTKLCNPRGTQSLLSHNKFLFVSVQTLNILSFLRQSGLASRPLANLAGELIFLDFLWSSFELFVVLGAFVPELSCEHLDI